MRGTVSTWAVIAS